MARGLAVEPFVVVSAWMYCAECREPGRFAWQHADDCREGLKHKLSFYQWLLGWVLLLLLGETALLVVAFVLMGRSGS